MANCLFGWPVWSDVGILYTPTLSGGSWNANLPLTNLQDRRLAKVARSSSAAITSTLFDVDLKATRNVRLVAIPKHTLSSAGQVRARGFTTLPLVDWLDFSTGWSTVLTPSRSGAALTSPDGIPLDLIGDDDGAAAEYYRRVVPFASNGTKAFSFRWCVGSSPAAGGSQVWIVDVTAGSTNRGVLTITQSGGVPTVTPSAGATVLSTTHLGSGVYRIVATAAGVLTANSNELRAAPCATAAQTGNVYLGDFMVWDTSTDQLVAEGGRLTPWPSGLTVEDIDGLNVPYVKTWTSDQAARYWRIEVFDTANTAGVVDLGRLIIAGGFQPTINLSRGATFELETESERQVTDGGAALYNERPVRRTLVGLLDDQSEAEMFGSFWKMQKQLGITGQLFFVYNPSDTTYLHDRAFLAVFRKLTPLEDAYIGRYKAPFALVEEL